MESRQYQTFIESYIYEYVLEKSGERVKLEPKMECITLKSTAKGGSTLLAGFWLRILQHGNNFPNEKYTYQRKYDRNKDSQVVKLLLDDNIIFTVVMNVGTLLIQGSFVYEWFMKNFQTVLEGAEAPVVPEANYRIRYRATPRFSPRKMESNGMAKHIAEKEKALSSRTPRSQEKDYDSLLRRSYGAQDWEPTETDAPKYITQSCRLERQVEDLIPGLQHLRVDKNLWGGSELQHRLNDVRNGALKDGPRFVYQLWKSLLNKWFGTDGCKVFISTPFLDAPRLAVICSIYLSHKSLSSIDTMYVQRRCDPKDKEITISDVKRDALKRFDAQTQTVIEYKIFRRILYPGRRFNSTFIAGLKDERAEVLVTSACFHREHFDAENLETVSYHEFSEDEFHDNYIAGLGMASIDTYP